MQANGGKPNQNNYIDGDRAGSTVIVPHNLGDRKARLKTSQGTKSGTNGIANKLPLMHNTLDNPNNHLIFMKGSKQDRNMNNNGIGIGMVPGHLTG